MIMMTINLKPNLNSSSSIGIMIESFPSRLSRDILRFGVGGLTELGLFVEPAEVRLCVESVELFIVIGLFGDCR